MIHEKKGDLLTAKGIILHGVNCQGVMGSGVALAIKEKWPEVFRVYKQFVTTNNEFSPRSTLLGGAQSVETSDGVVVWNLFTQLGYGPKGKQYASYDAIDTAMARVASLHDMNWSNDINFPLIGCDRGGLHWPIVREIIDHRIPDTFTKTLWVLP